MTAASAACPGPDQPPTGKIAYSHLDDDGDWSLWLMDPDGSNPVCLLDTPQADAAPAWSPDGHPAGLRRRGRPLMWPTPTARTSLCCSTERGPTASPTRTGHRTGRLHRVLGYPRGSGGARHHGHRLHRTRSADPDQQRRAVRLRRRTPVESRWAPYPVPGRRLQRVARPLSDAPPMGPMSSCCSSGASTWTAAASVGLPTASSLRSRAIRDGGCLYVVDASGKNVRRLVEGCSEGVDLTWSPDSRTILWGPSDNGPGDLYEVPSHGGASQVVEDTSTAASPSWQPH